MSMIEASEVREIVVDTLRRKGYAVTDIAEGQGVPRLSRVEIVKDGEKLVCAIKVGSRRSGRISFARDEEGFTVLPNVDRVIYAGPLPAGQIVIMMFKQSTVLKAFETNYQMLVKRGRGHFPVWVNPEPEENWRMTGSGFKDQAVWSEVVSLSKTSPSSGTRTTAVTDYSAPPSGTRTAHVTLRPPDSAPSTVPGTSDDGPARPLTIAEAKRGLALTFKVPVDAVEITIRG